MSHPGNSELPVAQLQVLPSVGQDFPRPYGDMLPAPRLVREETSTPITPKRVASRGRSRRH